MVTGVCRSLSGPGPARWPRADVTELAQAGRSRTGGEGWVGGSTALLRPEGAGGGGTEGATALPQERPGGPGVSQEEGRRGT